LYSIAVIAESADGMYVGENTRNKAGQIRVVSITYQR